MVRIQETITVSAGIQECFDFIADFRNLPKWNPNDERVELLTDPPLRLGSIFKVNTSLNDRKMILDYEVVEWGSPLRAALATDSKLFSAIDYVDLSANKLGTEVTYTGDFTFKGIMKIVAPIFITPKLRKLFSENVVNLKDQLGFVDTETI